MKKQIAEEIERIKQLEEAQAEKLKEEEEERKRAEAEARAIAISENEPIVVEKPREPSPPDELEITLQSKLMIEKLRIEKEREEMRIKSEEARKAADRREHAKQEAKRLKKEAEIAIQKAIEEEMKRLKEIEEQERRERVEAERLRLKEEERRAAEKIRLRKFEEAEQEKRAQEEAEAQKLRDQEEIKRLMMENMKRKLAADEEKKKLEEEAAVARPKKRGLVDNPLLQRFEELSKQEELKQKALEEARLRNAKKKAWKKKSKDVLRMSRLMVAQALSKDKLSTNEGKSLIKAVSREILRMVSKDNLNKRSNSSLKRSRDVFHGSKDIMKTKSKCNMSKDNLLSPGNYITSKTDKPSNKDMKNYLISHVLFDGKEDVQTEKTKSTLRLQAEAEAKRIEAEKEAKRFESYKREMEKYLDFIGESEKETGTKTKKKKKKSEVASTEEASEKKLLVNIGSIKTQFETLASPEAQEQTPAKPVSTKKVGKLNTKDLFSEQEKEQEEQIKKKKKDYVPVIIDRDAFERTVGRFASTRQEEEEKPVIKREKRVWIPPALRGTDQDPYREKSEEKCDPEEDDEYDEEYDNEQEEDYEEELEQEPEPELEPEPEPEPELTEEEKIKKMDIFTRIQYELDKLRKQEGENKQKIERENKKREVARQIQEQIERIKSMNEPKEEPKTEETPAWVRMVEDPDGWKKYKQQQSLEEEAKKENASKTEETQENKENVPLWIKLIKERQKQLRQCEVEYRERQEKEIERQTQKQKDSKVSKDEHDAKKIEVVSLNKDFSAKKSENLSPLKTFSNVKDLFEQQNSEELSPTATKMVSPYEINPDRVKLIKEQLLKSREKEKSKVDKKEDGFLAKKCSAIKNKLEQAFSGSSTDEKKLSVKKPKKIIKVSEELSIDEALRLKKQQNADKKWSYKQKDMKDLFELLESNNLSDNFQKKAEVVEQQLSNITKKRQELLNIQEKIEEQDVEDYVELMDRVHDYLSEKDALNPEEKAFRQTIQGYLALIEEGDEKQIKKKKSKSKSSKGNQKSFDSMPTKSIQAIKLDMEKSQQVDDKMSSSQTIGKLKIPHFSQKDSETAKSPTDVGTNVCTSIRDQLLKNADTNQYNGEKIVRTMKLVQIDQPKSVEESLKELKAQRLYEWKWKSKRIEDLQLFITENKIKEEINLNLDVPNINPEENSASENVSFDSGLDDYMKLMENIKNYLQTDTQKSSTVDTLKESLCNYLDLIELEPQKEEKANDFEWKPLGNVKDMTNGFENVTDTETSEKSLKTVGKLNLPKYESSEADNLERPQIVTRTSSYFCDSIKSQLEKKLIEKVTEGESISKTIKFVQTPQNESYDEALKHLKARRTEEWKWKKKAIEDLNSYLKKNKEGSKITANLDTNVKRFNNDSDLHSLTEKSEQLARSIKERDKTMNYFMKELQEFSDQPSENTDQVAVKEGIKAFLDLIDDGGSSSNTKALPEIMSPFKIDTKRKKYLDEIKPKEKEEKTKLVGKVDAKNLFTRQPSIKEKKIVEVQSPVDKTSVIKKFFETTKGSSMSRTMSELSLKPKEKRPKVIIDAMKKPEVQIPQIQRRGSVKRQLSIPSYFSNTKPQTRRESEPFVTKPTASEWDQFDDPEERKKAILAKHGFKPHQAKEKDDDPLKGLDTIPDHILQDEILYKKYMKEHIQIDDELSSGSSTPERQRDPKQGSFSSLMNILNMVKKAGMQKNAMESRKMLDDISKRNQEPRISSSVQDLSHVPGSCQNVRALFEGEDEEEDSYQPRNHVQRTASCSNLNSIWNQHLANSVQSKSKEAIDKSSIKSGLVNNLREHLVSNGNDNSYALNDPVKRLSLSHLEIDENDEPSTNHSSSIKMELEALRSSGQNKGIFKLEHGKSSFERSSLRRAQSHIDVVSGSKEFLELDDEEMAELKVNNRQVRAMFEASAPKYKYGGSGDMLNLPQERKGPVMRPSAKPKEERKWVLDTINQYFDVIVEEEDEESDDDESIDIDDSMSDMEDEDQIEADYRSSNRMRALLSRAAANVSESQSNLANLSKLKQNLGSRISLGMKASMENLSSL